MARVSLKSWSGLDLVIHGAAATGFNLSDRAYREVNIGGTANVLALIGQRGQATYPRCCT